MNAARRRGQPLAILALVLGGWATARVALWESPFPVFEAPVLDFVERTIPGGEPVSTSIAAQSREEARFDAPVLGPSYRVVTAAAPIELRPSGLGTQSLLQLVAPPRALSPLAPPRVIAGHQLMMLAALGRLGKPSSLASRREEPVVTELAPVAPLALARASRWSGDGWVLLRRGSEGLAAGPAFARYGASQAGAVLRYSLAPQSALRPQAHARLTSALGGFDEGEVAAGASLRPISAVPLRLLAEGRIQRTGGRTPARPALAAISELPPLPLPLGAEAEIYAAAGYVGGRNATPFFDAQVTADRPVLSRGPTELRVGAGAWAGGQDGAARLDLGPRASVRLRLGAAPSRLALDWRFRVAGNAAPASGPALTFSAGF